MMSTVLRMGIAAVLVCCLSGCALGARQTETQKRADSIMVDRVEQALSSDDELFSRHITVWADAGVVRLTGFVWDPPDLVAAERIAGSVPGVTRVVNSLELQRNGMDNSPVSR